MLLFDTAGSEGSRIRNPLFEEHHREITILILGLDNPCFIAVFMIWTIFVYATKIEKYVSNSIYAS